MVVEGFCGGVTGDGDVFADGEVGEGAVDAGEGVADEGEEGATGLVATADADEDFAVGGVGLDAGEVGAFAVFAVFQ